MRHAPLLRIYRVFEDADENGELSAPEPEDAGAAHVAPDADPLLTLRYMDQHPWRCGPCNQPVLPGWSRYPVCGLCREDCEQ